MPLLGLGGGYMLWGGGPKDGSSSEMGNAHEHEPAVEYWTCSDRPSPIEWLGRLRPMAVHFPIALLLLAAGAELLVILTGAERYAFAARFCLWGGALGALAAAPRGWTGALAVEADYVGFAAKLLFFHRWVGVATALAAGAALLACERIWRRETAPGRRTYRAFLFLSALLVSAAGHLGASLIYGWEYLSW